jgi:hypothetical protein
MKIVLHERIWIRQSEELAMEVELVLNEIKRKILSLKQVVCRRQEAKSRIYSVGLKKWIGT